MNCGEEGGLFLGEDLIWSRSKGNFVEGIKEAVKRGVMLVLGYDQFFDQSIEKLLGGRVGRPIRPVLRDCSSTKGYFVKIEIPYTTG